MAWGNKVDMDRQSKFLSKEYLETRLRDFSAIKKHELYFQIYESNRVLSKTLYIEFWVKDGNKNFRQQTIRISDHIIDCSHAQFIVDPYACLTKKKKQQFIRLIESVIKLSKRKSLYRKLENLSQGKKDGKNA